MTPDGGVSAPIRHTRSIAAQGFPPHDGESRHERDHREQVTGSLERVSLVGPDQDALIAQVRDAAFPLALRGYDREAVDAYVKRVNRLITDLEASRSPEAAIRRALDQVGEETSGILQRAQETASEITERSRASADDRIREAEREARSLTVDAEDRVRELEADYGAIWARRDRLLDEVRDLAERLLATADDAGERFPTRDEEAAGEDARVDTASFPQLGAAAGDVEQASELGIDAAEVDDDSTTTSLDAREPASGDLRPGSGERLEDEEEDFLDAPSAWSPGGSGEERPGVSTSPEDEVDFADAPGDDLPDDDHELDERSPGEPRSS